MVWSCNIKIIMKKWGFRGWLREIVMGKANGAWEQVLYTKYDLLKAWFGSLDGWCRF